MEKIIIIIFFLLPLNFLPPKSAYSQVNPIWQVSFNDSLPEDNFAVKSKIDSEDNIVILARGTNSSLGTGVDFFAAVVGVPKSLLEEVWSKN